MGREYSISEIANVFNITTNKIRFYEKKGLISPIRQNENKYRKFNEEDILKLQSILLYRSIGLSIDDIKAILKDDKKENYITHFNDQWQLINDQIHRLTVIRQSLECVLDKIYEETDEYEIQNDLIEIIEKNNKLIEVKESWKDKWDFNNWAKSYDKDIRIDRGRLKIYKNYDFILQRVYDLAQGLEINNSRILEIGVGTGNLASKFLDNDNNIIGIDQSREMLSVAKGKYPNLKVRLGEFLKIPYDNNSFDIIVSTYAFHHLNDEEKCVAIKEMMRVLKDGGAIIIGDLMFESKESKNEIIRSLSEEEIMEIEDEYYSDIIMLINELKKYNKKLEYEKIDLLNYIIKIK